MGNSKEFKEASIRVDVYAEMDGKEIHLTGMECEKVVPATLSLDPQSFNSSESMGDAVHDQMTEIVETIFRDYCRLDIFGLISPICEIPEGEFWKELRVARYIAGRKESDRVEPGHMYNAEVLTLQDELNQQYVSIMETLDELRAHGRKYDAIIHRMMAASADGDLVLKSKEEHHGA